MTAILWIIAVLIMLVGIVGTVLPAIPGVPLIFAGMLLAAWINDFQIIRMFTVFVMAILTALAIITDYVAAALFAKRAGAAIGELIARKDMLHAGKVGVATWFGLIVATIVKLAVAFTMVGVFVAALLI